MRQQAAGKGGRETPFDCRLRSPEESSGQGADWKGWNPVLEQVLLGGSPLSHTITMSLEAKVRVIFVLCHRSVTDCSQLQAHCFVERLETKECKNQV